MGNQQIVQVTQEVEGLKEELNILIRGYEGKKIPDEIRVRKVRLEFLISNKSSFLESLKERQQESEGRHAQDDEFTPGG